jgi:chorismate synthase
MDPVEIDPRRAEQRRVHMPRPGHTDLAGGEKYLRSDLRDILERASARETAARVAAGAIAQLFLKEFGIEIKSAVRSLGPVGADAPPPTWEQLCAMADESPLRAADPALEPEMIALVDRAKEEGDTLGGSVTVIAHGVPVGLGSHVQWNEKLDGRLAQALMGIHAIKAVEIGSAIAAAGGFGSEAHDPIVPGDDGKPTRAGNRAGGLEGGVTNGMDLVVTAFKKPIATLRKGMPSMDLDTLEPHQSQYERSDVTALPAAGVIAEAMVALVLADALLEKLGGDSMAEVRAHWEVTRKLQREWLPLR